MQREPMLDRPGQLDPLENGVCGGCGCVCDDIRLQWVETHCSQAAWVAQTTCPIGRRWFQSPQPTIEACRIDGRSAEINEGIARAVQRLSAARRPLIYGLQWATSQTQQAAIQLARRLAAVLDTPASQWHWATTAAMQQVGQVTCTLGEIKSRADVLVAWGCDPLARLPRLLERCGWRSDHPSPDHHRHQPDDSRPRRLIVVDNKENQTANVADETIALRPGGEFAALTALRAIASGAAIDDQWVQRESGQPINMWQALWRQMTGGYCAVLYTPQQALNGDRGAGVAAAQRLFALSHDARRGGAVLAVLPVHPWGNLVGADELLTAAAGGPFAIDFSGTRPRFDPLQFTAERLLAGRAVDTVLSIGADPLTELPNSAAEYLGQIPLIAIDAWDTPTMHSAEVALAVGRPGRECPGTFFRLDGIALNLDRDQSTQLPCAESLLKTIAEQLPRRL